MLGATIQCSVLSTWRGVLQVLGILEQRSGEDSFKRILEGIVAQACRAMSGMLLYIYYAYIYMCILQCVVQCAMQQVTLQYKRVWFGWPAVRLRPSPSGPGSTAHQSLGLLHRQDGSV